MEISYCPFCGTEAEARKHAIHEGGDLHFVFHFGCFNEACAVKPQTHVPGPWYYTAHQEWWDEHRPGRYCNTEEEAATKAKQLWANDLDTPKSTN